MAESPQAQLRVIATEVRELADALTALRGEFEKLAENYRDIPVSFRWGDLDPGEWSSRETRLREWVVQVLTDDHPQVASRLPWCWFDHPHPRALVTGNWLAWLAAYRAKGRRMTDPDDYLTRRLPALDAALKYEFGHGSERCEQHDQRR